MIKRQQVIQNYVEHNRMLTEMVKEKNGHINQLVNENARLRKALDEMESVALWSACRLRPVHKPTAYNAIEKALGKEVERV